MAEPSTGGGVEVVLDRQPVEGRAAATGRSRLLGVDVARGIALIMIAAAHVLEYSNSAGGPSWGYVRGSEGAALFVLLAGVGISLSTPASRVGDRASWLLTGVSFATRAAAISVIGLALGYVVDYEEHAIVVLMTFGLLFLVAIPLLRLSAKQLAMAAVAAAILAPVLIHLARPYLPAPELINPTFGDVLTDPLGWLSTLLLTGIYPAVPWAVYLCAGMAVGRLSLSSVTVAVRLFAAGLALAIVASLASWALASDLDLSEQLFESTSLTEEEIDDVLQWGAEPDRDRESGWYLLIDAPHASLPFDLIRTSGVALAITGACLLLGRAASSRVLRPVAAAGALTLSLYTLHLLALTWFTDAWGYVSTYVVHVAAMLVLGSLWLRFFRRGPIETVVRDLESRAVRAAAKHVA